MLASSISTRYNIYCDKMDIKEAMLSSLALNRRIRTKSPCNQENRGGRKVPSTAGKAQKLKAS